MTSLSREMAGKSLLVFQVAKYGTIRKLVYSFLFPFHSNYGHRDRQVWVRGPGWPDHCVRL